MEFDSDKIKARLLYHLRRKKVIDGVHTQFNTLSRGFPSHLKGAVKQIAQDLIREGLITTKQTSYGLQVSLNKDRIKQIEDFIFKTLDFRFQFANS